MTMTTTEMVPWIVALVILLGIAVYWFLRFSWEHQAYGELHKQWTQERREHLDDLEDTRVARAAWEKLRDMHVRHQEEAEARATKAIEELERVRSGLALNTKLLESQAMVNEDLVKEKTEAWALQQTQALMYGNGQSVLLGQLQRLLNEYNNYRVSKGDRPVEPRPEVKQIMEQAGAEA